MQRPVRVLSLVSCRAIPIKRKIKIFSRLLLEFLAPLISDSSLATGILSCFPNFVPCMYIYLLHGFRVSPSFQIFPQAVRTQLARLCQALPSLSDYGWPLPHPFHCRGAQRKQARDDERSERSLQSIRITFFLIHVPFSHRASQTADHRRRAFPQGNYAFACSLSLSPKFHLYILPAPPSPSWTHWRACDPINRLSRCASLDPDAQPFCFLFRFIRWWLCVR